MSAAPGPRIGILEAHGGSMYLRAATELETAAILSCPKCGSEVESTLKGRIVGGGDPNGRRCECGWSEPAAGDRP